MCVNKTWQEIGVIGRVHGCNKVHRKCNETLLRQGGDDIIYDSGDSTLAGNQIIHCDQFWIKHFANVTIPGDYIVIFAKHRILIEGDLNILRSNLAYDGNHSQQQVPTL